MSEQTIPLSVLRQYRPDLRMEDLEKLGPIEYDQSKVPDTSRKHADNIRRKVYGVDILESQARGVEYAGLVSSVATKTAQETQLRQDSLEAYNAQVIAEMTDKDVISAPEIIAARNGRQTLSERLAEDGEKIELVQTAFRQFTVNIADFGVVYDDPTFDNMPIIALAQDYVSAHGSGDVYFPNLGELFVKPVLKLKSGVKLRGAVERPVIKVAPDVEDFYMLFGIENSDHNAITDLTIDANYENRTGYDISVSPQILIQLTNAEYVDVSRNTLKGHGVWVFAVFTGGNSDYSRFVKFNDNHVIWKAGTSSNIIGGTYGVDVDNTTVYWDAIDYEMKNNYIQTRDGKKNMTCIEVHGANAVVENNTILGFRTGMIVWSLVANTAKSAIIARNNHHIINNRFLNVEAGITNGSTQNEAYGTFNLESVYIIGNSILMAPSNFDRASGRGIELNLKTKGKDFKIFDNVVESLENSRSFADPNTVYNFTGLSINGGEISGVDIQRNTFRNINGIGLLVQAGVGQVVKLIDSTIKDNLFIDCGRGGNIAFDGYQHRTAITIGRGSNTQLIRTPIGVNEIRDSKPNGTYFTRPVNGLLATDEDQNITTASRGNWTGNVEVSVPIQIDGGDNEYIRPTTNESRNVVFGKDLVSMSSTIWIDKDYSGNGVYLHLPLQASVETWNYYNGSWSHYKADTGEVVTGRFIINPENVNIARFVLPELRGYELKRNDYLWFDFAYPVEMMAKYRI